MTAQLHRFPASPLMEARAELVATSRALLRSPEPQADQDIRNACLYLQTWGRPEDYITAHHALVALEMRRAERAEDMRLAVQQEAKRGTIRRALWDAAAFFLFAVAVLVVGGAL